ncbi:P-loop NTPase [candidate division KSB3 bacterium]|uniref:Iron-sulfur cluster carrier protein n=1 Tax=candidate division KSB3 bacterium TaxID=2044937 RepID=A0A9D5JVU2_9BACT|nr:P-loop NTPase [candidate division KSB3 bacterium]
MAATDQDNVYEQAIANHLEHIKHILVVMSGKGGVGKSTVAANLAVTLARKNYRVGLMDADIHGPNIPKMLGIERSHMIGSDNGIKPVMYYPNLKVVSIALLLQSTDDAVIWRGPLKHRLIQQFVGEIDWGDLEYLVVDLPPGTGDEPLSVAHVITRIDAAIIVTTPQDVALLDSRKTVTFARKLHLPIGGIVENMSGFVCPHCGTRTDIFKTGGGERTAQEMHVPFLGKIPLDAAMVTVCDDGTPYVEKYPTSEVAKAFLAIAACCGRDERCASPPCHE